MVVPGGEDNLNIPFNIPGNAEETLQRIEDRVRSLTAALNNMQTALRGPREAVHRQARAVEQQAEAYRDAVREMRDYAEAEKEFLATAEELEPTIRQEVRALRAATREIDKRILKTQKLINLQRVGRDSSATLADGYHSEADSLTEVNRRLADYAKRLRVAQELEKRNATLLKQSERDILAKARGQLTQREEEARARQVATIQKNLQRDIELNRRKIAAAKRADESKELAHMRKMQIALRAAEKENAQIAELKRRQRIEQEKIRKAQERSRRELRLFNREGNRSLFIFRRLFGVLAAFTLARLGLESFFGGIRASLEFNKNIEQAQLGIASLFTAVGNVRDALGGAVSRSDQLALAQKEAARQTDLLRRDALSTAATFDELLTTFQIGLAPGLAAGLNIDQIREFTIRISQAAAAIGLQQNQLAEEIRSILQGTIQARTTRIAVALGITNEDIRRMKEVGKLNEFLTAKFAAFEEAGTKAMTTMAGLISRVRDAFFQLVGLAGKDFFKQAKEGLKDLFGAFTEVTEEKLIEPSPEAVKGIREIFDGIAQATKDAREFAKELGADSIGNTAHLIGAVIKNGMAIIFGIAQGLIAAFGVIKNILSAIGFEGNTKELRQWVASATKIVILFLAANSALSITIKLYERGVILLEIIHNTYLTIMRNAGRLVALTTRWVKGLRAILPALKFIGVQALIIVGPFVAAAAAVQQMLQELTGIQDLGLFESLKIVGASLKNFWEQLWVSLKLTVSRVADFIGNVFKNPIKAVSDLLLDMAETALAAVSFIPGAIGTEAEAALNKIYKLQARLQTGGPTKSKTTLDLEKELIALQKDAAENAEKTTEEIRKQRIEEDKLKDTQTEVVEESIKFKEIMEDLPIAIGVSADALTVAEGTLKSLRDEAEALRLESDFNILGLSGSAAEQQKIALQTAKRVQTELRDINASILEQEEKLASFKKQGNLLAKAALNLSKEDQESFTKLLEIGRAYTAIKGGISKKEEEILLVALELKSAEEDRNEELVKQKRAELNNLKIQKKSLENHLKIAEAAGQAATAAASPEALEFAQKGLTTLGQQKVIRDDITVATENLKIAEGEILKLGQQRLDQLRQEQFLTAVRDIESLQGEVRAMEEITRFKQGAVASDQHQVNLAKIRLDNLQIEADTLAEQHLKNLDFLEKQVAETEEGSKERISAEATLNAEREKGSLELEVQNEKIRQAQEEARILGLIAKGSISQGLVQGLKNFAEEFKSSFKAGITIAYSATNQLADFISTSIVDAFDPTTKTTLKERFGRFVKSIAKTILDQLAKIYIAKLAIKALSFGFSSGGEIGTDGVAVGATKGGWIPKLAYASHYGPQIQGLARGGPPRPKGLHPKDTVPIWAQIGEFMMRVSAVRKYGKETMAKINAGLIDPMGLKALAGNTAPMVARKPVTPGFQEGGVISEIVQKQAAEDLAHQTAATDEETITRAVIVSSEEEFDKLLAGGRGAMFKFFKENSADIEGILQKERL